jgi:hypothetical protein
MVRLERSPRRLDGKWLLLVPLLLWVAVLGLRAAGSLLPPSGLWDGEGRPALFIDSVALGPSELFAGGLDGLFVSIDHGASWMPVEAVPAGTAVTAVVAGRDLVFAAGAGQLWERRGDEWAATPFPSGGRVHRLLLHEGELFAATEKGLFTHSASSPGEWRRLWPSRGASPAQAYSVAAIDGRILAGTDDGVVEVVAGGVEVRKMGPPGAMVLGVAAGGGWVHAAITGPGGGLARADMGSGRWQAGRVDSEQGVEVLVNPADPTRLLAGLGGLADHRAIAGVVESRDGGETWRPVKSRLLNSQVPSIAVDAERGIVYAATHGGGVFRYREPGVLQQAAGSLGPLLDLAEPALLGCLALAVLLRRRSTAG